jgi:hypothetical protein
MFFSRAIFFYIKRNRKGGDSKMIWTRRLITTGILLTALLFSGFAPAMADDVTIVTDLNGVGAGVFRAYDHEDANPFKGFLNLTVTNTGTEAWGDFHFYIFDAQGINSSSAIFTEDFAPSSSQDPLGYSITNDDHWLNLWFYGDPVNPGETATFQVYTDNTAGMLQFFGIGFYASPVPVPGALILLGSGLLGLLGLRRRRADV